MQLHAACGCVAALLTFGSSAPDCVDVARRAITHAALASLTCGVDLLIAAPCSLRLRVILFSSEGSNGCSPHLRFVGAGLRRCETDGRHHANVCLVASTRIVESDDTGSRSWRT